MNDFTRNRSLTLPGLYAGTVVGVDDPDQVGRIQVEVPSVFTGSEPAQHVWARPCFHDGHFFVPDVGDRVWLAFENGDPSRPVWLGTWYPADTTPDEVKVSPPTVRMIHSTTGHAIVLDDTDGAEKVTIRNQSGSSIEFTADAMTITAASDLTIDASGHAIVIKANSVDVQS